MASTSIVKNLPMKAHTGPTRPIRGRASFVRKQTPELPLTRGHLGAWAHPRCNGWSAVSCECAITGPTPIHTDMDWGSTVNGWLGCHSRHMRAHALQAWRKLGSWKSARTVNMQSPLESWQDRIGADLHHHGPVPDPKESCSRRCLVHSHGSTALASARHHAIRGTPSHRMRERGGEAASRCAPCMGGGP